MMHTAEPVAKFIMRISVSVIPSKDTSMDRCKEKIETKAFAKVIFRNVSRLTDVLFRALIHRMIASMILVKVYVAIASMATRGNTVPLSFTKARITVPTKERDSMISIAPVKRTRYHLLPLWRRTTKRVTLNMA